jgi:hypothetical protein
MRCFAELQQLNERQPPISARLVLVEDAFELPSIGLYRGSCSDVSEPDMRQSHII